MKKYRSKLVEVEAIELTFENQMEVRGWVGLGKPYSTPPMRYVTGIIFAVNMIALFGDWITKDIDGVFHVYKPDDFERAYESFQSTQQGERMFTLDEVMETFRHGFYSHPELSKDEFDGFFLRRKQKYFKEKFNIDI